MYPAPVFDGESGVLTREHHHLVAPEDGGALPPSQHPEDAVPEEAKKWTTRSGEWPSGDLINKVMAKGAHLVPKTFTEEKKKKNDKSRRWRINFDLNVIITDKEYSPKVDANRVLIILKDIKNAILPGYTPLVNSYFLKVAIAR